jgi:hypothetical protein
MISVLPAALDAESASDAVAKMAAPAKTIVIAIHIAVIFVPALGAIRL